MYSVRTGAILLAAVHHLARHSVTQAEFEQAMQNDPNLFDYQIVDGEERWTGLGSTDNLRVLVVVFTIREGRIRAVTAFPANKKRVREYLKWNGR